MNEVVLVINAHGHIIGDGQINVANRNIQLITDVLWAHNTRFIQEIY